MIFASLVAKLAMELSNWTKSKSTVVNDLHDMDAEQESFFKKLKANFGKSSTLGQSLKLAAGGGAIAGLTALAKEADQMAETIAAANDALDTGKIGQQEYATTIAHSIPIVGGFAKAIDSIIDSLDGQARAEKRLAEAQKERNKQLQEVITTQQKQATEAKDFVEDAEKQRRKFAQDARIAAESDPDTKKVLQAHFDEENQRADLEAKAKPLLYADKIKELEKEAKRQSDLQEQIRQTIINADRNPDFHDGNQLRSWERSIKYAAALQHQDEGMVKQLKLQAAKVEEEKNKVLLDIHQEYLSKLDKIDREATEKTAKEQAKAAHEAAIEATEDRKTELEAIIAEASKEKKQRDSALVSEIRGGPGIYFKAPETTDPNTQILKDSKEELKFINQKLTDLRRGGVDDTEVVAAM